jgi:hypothetical protein
VRRERKKHPREERAATARERVMIAIWWMMAIFMEEEAWLKKKGCTYKIK